MALRKAVFDRQILSLDVAGFAQSLTERGHKRCRRRRAGGAEDADHRHRLLLRAACERIRHRSAECDEQFAPFHQDTPSGQGMADAKPITTRAATRLGHGSLPYRVNRAASLATMPGIDDSFALPSDERTTWRQLAVAGRLTLWHSGSFRATPASRTRLGVWSQALM